MGATEDFLEYCETFRKRCELLDIPEKRWIVGLEECLTVHWRTVFWTAHREGMSFAELVSTMSGLAEENLVLKVRQEGDKIRQDVREGAVEFRLRLKKWNRRCHLVGLEALGEESLAELMVRRSLYAEEVQLEMDASDDKGLEAATHRLKLVMARHRGRTHSDGEIICRKCHKKGHKAKDCRSKSEVNPVVERKDTDRDSHKKPKGACWKCGKTGHKRSECKANLAQEMGEARTGSLGKRVGCTILLDSCAGVSVIRKRAVPEGARHVLEAISFHWGSELVQCGEAVDVDVELEGSKHLVRFYVIDEGYIGDADALLSRADYSRFAYQFVRAQPTQDTSGDVADLEPEVVLGKFSVGVDYRDSFEKLPRADTLMDLREPARVDPVRFEWSSNLPEELKARGYRYRPEDIQALREKAQELIDAGIYREGGASYASPWLSVAKKDGTRREVVDMRQINIYMKGDHFPVTSAEEVLQELGGFQIYSEIDLKSAIWQIPLSEADQERCCVTFSGSMLCPLRLPMGAKASQGKLERIVTEKLVKPVREKWSSVSKSVETGMSRSRKGAIAIYRDNIYLASDTKEDHRFLLDLVANEARRVNLRFGSGTIGVGNIPILGYRLSNSGMRPLKQNLDKIAASAEPRSKKELKTFLGRIGYYRHLVPRFADIIEPMERLTEKSVDFHWEREQRLSFEEIKKKLQQEAVLGAFVPGKTIEVYTDASDVAAGGVLIQDGKIVRAFSRRFSSSQKKYSVTRKEALGLIWSLQDFSVFLPSCSFTCFVDHQALVGWSRGCVSTDILLQRWALKLQEIAPQAQVVWIAGRQNELADGLSRKLTNLAQTDFKKIRKILKGDLVTNGESEDDQMALQRMSRRFKLDGESLLYQGKLVPEPEQGIKSWLEEQHIEFAHPSKSSFLKLLKAEWAWPTMEEDVRIVTEECDQCQRGTPAGEESLTMIRARRSNWEINDEWSADIINLEDVKSCVTPTPYCLTLVEGVSGFPEGYPLKSKSCEEIVRALRYHFVMFGYPRRLRTDRGAEFLGQETQRYPDGLQEDRIGFKVQEQVLRGDRPGVTIPFCDVWIS